MNLKYIYSRDLNVLLMLEITRAYIDATFDLVIDWYIKGRVE